MEGLVIDFFNKLGIGGFVTIILTVIYFVVNLQDVVDAFKRFFGWLGKILKDKLIYRYYYKIRMDLNKELSTPAFLDWQLKVLKKYIFRKEIAAVIFLYVKLNWKIKTLFGVNMKRQFGNRVV